MVLAPCWIEAHNIGVLVVPVDGQQAGRADREPHDHRPVWAGVSGSVQTSDVWSAASRTIHTFV